MIQGHQVLVLLESKVYREKHIHEVHPHMQKENACFAQFFKHKLQTLSSKQWFKYKNKLNLIINVNLKKFQFESMAVILL